MTDVAIQPDQPAQLDDATPKRVWGFLQLIPGLGTLSAGTGTSVRAPAEASHWGAIERRFIHADRVGVRSFLWERPALLRSLLRIEQKAAEYLPLTEAPRLRVLPTGDGGAELLLTFDVALRPSEALEALRLFDEGWWLEQSSSPELRELTLDVRPTLR